MTTLQVDFTQLPPAPPHRKVPQEPHRCAAYPWEFGVTFDLSKIYGDQTDSRKLLLISTGNSKNNAIYFSDGLILQTERARDVTSAGEGLGIAFDVSQAPPSSRIRIEVEFDYLAVATADAFYPWSKVEHDVEKEAVVPTYPPTGVRGEFSRLVQFIRNPLAWVRDDLSGVVPGTTRPFFGGVVAFCTTAPLNTNKMDVDNDYMAAAFLQVSYDPKNYEDERMRIAIPGFLGVPITAVLPAKMPFPFFVKKFRCPISKKFSDLYAIRGEPWTGNSSFSYFFQLQMGDSGGKQSEAASLGMRLLRATKNPGLFDELNENGAKEFAVNDGPPDTSKYTSVKFENGGTPSENHTGIHEVKFAGVSLQVGDPLPKNPTQKLGPARVRLKSLLVEYS